MRGLLVSAVKSLIKAKDIENLNIEKQALIFIASFLLLTSSFGLLELSSAMQATTSKAANRYVATSYTRLDGYINSWGTEDVRGHLQTQARSGLRLSQSTDKFASATAMWTTNLTREIQAVQSKENFTYCFYVARLPNASVTSSSVSLSEYSVSGTWKLANVTAVITINTNDQGLITHIHTARDIKTTIAAGQLTVDGVDFKVQADGMQAISGKIYSSITRSLYIPYKLTDSVTDSVTMADVKAIAECYGAMPGWGSYHLRMDFNNNYRIDIADISSIAAHT